jgi:hypothetical protein
LDDSDIWAISPGDELRCGRDLVMDDSGVIAFTAGRSYRVQSTHPIAQPPLLRVVDDQGESHGLSAADLAEYFVRPLMDWGGLMPPELSEIGNRPRWLND